MTNLSAGVLGLALAGAVPGCASDPACDQDAPNTICTIAGTGEQGDRGDLGPAVNAALFSPIDTAIAPDGEVWVLDFNNYLIRAIDERGQIRTVVGTGELGDSPRVADGELQTPALAAALNHMTSMVFRDGYLYVAAWHNSRIKRVRLSDMTLENFAGVGKRTLYAGDEGPALEAALDLPSSLALDPVGDLVILDQENQVIRRVDQDNVIHRIAGQCIVDADVPCGPGVEPVACPGSNKLTCGNAATECAKVCQAAFSGDGGSALRLRMAQPFGGTAYPGGGLVYDASGNLIFADSDNHRIRRIDPDGIVTTIAGTGVAGYSNDGGPARDAQLDRPGDVAAAPDGTIYFTDVSNNCVRKIDPAGIITSVVGVCSSDPAARGFAGDGGPPLEARLDRPHGIDLVGSRLYVTDSGNNRIRVVRLR